MCGFKFESHASSGTAELHASKHCAKQHHLTIRTEGAHEGDACIPTIR